MPITTLSAIDTLLGGGLQRGKLVELVSRRAAGRFSIVEVERLRDRLARCGRSGCGVLRRTGSRNGSPSS